jgi:chloride channel 3/4/5
MYTLFSILFAMASAFLVKYYAPYAAGEGVPEIKTILGGFVIRKFLGGWTLLVGYCHG